MDKNLKFINQYKNIKYLSSCALAELRRANPSYALAELRRGIGFVYRSTKKLCGAY